MKKERYKNLNDSKFLNWLFATPKKSKAVELTQEQKDEKSKINGGWVGDELFIPMMTKREYYLRYANVWKAIAYFCIPTVILMLTQGLYNILDKSLALQFATPHATQNWEYIQKMIIGSRGSSILSEALSTSDDKWNAFIKLFDVSQINSDKLSEIKNLINSNNASMEQIKEAVYGSGITIQADVIKQYINVTTQYTMQTYNLAYAFSQIMAIGAGMHYAVEFGRRNRDKLGEITANGISQSIIVSFMVGGLLLMLSLPSMGQVLITSQMSGHKNEVVEALAWSDVEPLIFGISTMFVAGVTMNMIRSEGKMWHIMVMTLTSLIVKCGVSIIAMKYGGLELTGAQLGTIAAFSYQIVYCLIVIFFSKISYSKFKMKDLFILRNENWIETIKAGVPNFIIYFAVVVNSYTVTTVVIKLPIPKSGPSFAENHDVSILQQLISSMTPWAEFILSACIGLNQGVRTMIAYNYGAQRNARIISILKRSTWLMFAWFVFIFMLIVAAGPSMMTMFAFPKEYAQYGNTFYWYQFLYFFTYPFASLTYIALGLFQGTRKSKAATIATSLRSMVVFLPMLGIGYAISIATGDSLWFFLFVGLSDLVSGIILLPMLIAFYLRAKQANKLVDTPESILTSAIYNKTMYEKTKQEFYYQEFKLLEKELIKQHKQME